ncbi:MAG: alpha/beta family hydrolase [Alphaproteobacteria bacterium]|jgi:predicted alpha/beta-hydrolase family hydrolase
MTKLEERNIRIAVGEGDVSGLLIAPEDARACFVFAHGAGVGMQHEFMRDVADGLAERCVATLRYQFPYMERGSKRPDSPKVAQAAVRAAVAKAKELLPKLPLFAGGKSYGARMTSQAQAEAPLPDVKGMVFLGFPLHPPGQPSDTRAEHLSRVQIPMLFLQGTRDDFADLEYLQPLVKRLGSRATLKLFEDSDHSFHVPAKSGRTDAEVMRELLDALVAWMEPGSGDQ